MVYTSIKLQFTKGVKYIISSIFIEWSVFEQTKYCAKRKLLVVALNIPYLKQLINIPENIQHPNTKSNNNIENVLF